MEVLATRIRELRLARGISSMEMAANMLDPRTTGKTWSVWERDLGDPDLENLVALALFFGVTPNYLLGFSDERERPESPANKRFYPAREGA